MKSSVVLVCLCLAALVVCDVSKREKRLVIASIQEVIVKYFAKQYPKIELLYFGSPGGLAEQIINELMISLPVGMTILVSTRLKIDNLQSSTIMLFDTLRHFEELDIWEEGNQFVTEMGLWPRHLVYAPELKADDITRIFKDNPMISEVNFLINFDGSSIQLATSFLFEYKKCNLNQIKTMNRFSLKTNRWEHSDFYTDKFRNFNGCPIEVFYNLESTNDIGTKIWEALSEKLNFKLKRIRVGGDEVFEEENEKRMSEHVSMQEDNVQIDTELSAAIYVDSLTFAIPPGEPLTDLERMFAAFDDETWIWIGVTFTVAVIVILIVSCMPRRVQDFVYGRSIRAPLLNLLDIFLNGGINRVPEQNFPRYLLVLFIFWSLIFRTCYQSMMFENLNSDMRRGKVQTFEELDEKNFSWIHFKDDKWFTKFNYSLENNKTKFDSEQKWFDLVAEPPNKFTHLTFRAEYFKEIKKKLQRTEPSTSLVEQNVATIPFFIRLPRFLPHSRACREKINQMIANGIIQKWHEEFYLVERNPKKYVDEVEPQVLTVRMLRFGFIIYLIFIAVSAAVFVAEIIYSWVSITLDLQRAAREKSPRRKATRIGRRSTRGQQAKVSTQPPQQRITENEEVFENV